MNDRLFAEPVLQYSPRFAPAPRNAGPMIIAMQLVGAALAVLVAARLFRA